MWNLWDTLQSSTSLPLSLLQFRAPPFSLIFSSIEASFLSFLSEALSWWWSSSFHGLFPSGWHFLSPLLLYLPLHLHGGKSPLKDLIEAQRSSLHRSFTSKLSSFGRKKTGVHHFSLFDLVATYPSAGGRRETHGIRKEYARSRHQRLFEENVGKTGKDAIYELFKWKAQELYLRAGKVLAPHTSVTRDDSL